MLDFVDPADVATIESLQPYKPGGVTRLSILERFLNTDKHRLMHGAVANLIAKPEVIAARKIPMPTTSIDYLPGGHAIRDGDELARFRFSPYVYQRVLPDGSIEVPNPELAADFQFHAAMVFGEPGNEDVRWAQFGSLLKDVRGIIARFE
jgi:hypothetical protein